MKTVYWEDRNLDGQALADEFLRLLNLPVTTARFPITAVGTPSNISSVGPALGRLSAPLSAKRPFPKRRPHLPRQRRCQDSLPRRIQIFRGRLTASADQVERVNTIREDLCRE